MSSGEANPLLSLTSVRKTLPGFHLGPINLSVEPGYVLAILGPNGSGKSTLLRMLPGLVHPDSGGLRAFGRDYFGQNLEVRSRIGYVPDTSVGHEEMNAPDLGVFVGHWYPTWDQDRYEELLKQFDIDPKKRFKSLSKGVRKRLSTALAVATQTQLLVLDEPTESLDPLVRKIVLDEISSYVEKGGRSVLLATHIVDDVKDIADYVAFMYDGRLLGVYEKDELMESWKAMWVDAAPDGDLPGLVSVEPGRPARLVTHSPAETRSALQREGFEVVRTAALDLDEILGHLVGASAGDAAGSYDGKGRP